MRRLIVGSKEPAEAKASRKDGLLSTPQTPPPLARQRSGTPSPTSMLEIPRMPTSRSTDDLAGRRTSRDTSLGTVDKSDRRVTSTSDLGRSPPSLSPLGSPRATRQGRSGSVPPAGLAASSFTPLSASVTSLQSSASSLHSAGDDSSRRRTSTEDCSDTGRRSPVAPTAGHERRRSLPTGRRRESLETATHARRLSGDRGLPVEKLLNPREEWVRPWRQQGTLQRVSGVDVFELLSHELFSRDNGNGEVGEAALRFRDWIRAEFENRNRDYDKEIGELRRQLEALHQPTPQAQAGLTAAFDRVNSLLVRQSNLEAELLRTRCQCEEFAAKLGKFAASIAAWSERAPHGRVTLVYTDIQGSTGLWEAYPEDMARALATHDAVLRRLLGEIGGYEVKTVGDSFMVCFQEALPAVKWCLRAQLELLSADWPGVFHGHADSQLIVLPTGQPLFRGLRVRMGVHTGVASMVHQNPISGRTDYYGPFVNRAARVESLARGGEVLVTDAVLAEIEGDMKAIGSPAVADMGEHSLKGLDTRQKIYQFLPREVAARSFPPLQSPGPGDKDTPKEDDAPGPSGHVSLVYCRVDGAEELWAQDFAVMKHAMCVHDGALRACTSRLGGYAVRSEACTWMAAFASAVDAAAFCAEVHRAMLDAEWPDALLERPQAAVVVESADVGKGAIEGEQGAIEGTAPNGTGQVVFRGLRLRVAMHTGHPTCVEDATSRRTQYIGPDVSVLMHVAEVARGGQSLVTDAAHAAYRAAVDKATAAIGAVSEGGPAGNARVKAATISMTSVGQHVIRGVETAIALFELTSDRVPRRKFPPLEDRPAEDSHGPEWAKAQLQELQQANDGLVGRLQRIARKSEEASGEALVLRKALDEMRKAQDADPAAMAIAYEQIETFRREQEGLRRAVAEALLRNRTLTTKMDDFDSQLFAMNSKVEHERMRRLAAQAVSARARAAIAALPHSDADACDGSDDAWRTLPLPALSRESSAGSEVASAAPGMSSSSTERELAMATITMETEGLAVLVAQRLEYVASLRARLSTCQRDRDEVVRAAAALESRVAQETAMHTELLDTVRALTGELDSLRVEADALRQRLSQSECADNADVGPAPASARGAESSAAAMSASARRRAVMARVEQLVQHFEGKGRGT